YTDPAQIAALTFTESCNGYTVVLSNIQVKYDPIVTATQGTFAWTANPPFHPSVSFTATFTAPQQSPPSQPYKDHFADTSGAMGTGAKDTCQNIPDAYIPFFTGSSGPVTRSNTPCIETFMQLQNLPGGALGGNTGVTMYAFFGVPNSPGIGVDLTVHYKFTPGGGTCTVANARKD